MQLGLGVGDGRLDRRWTASPDDVGHDRDDEEDQKHKEEDLSDARGGCRNASESKNRSDDRNDEEQDSKAKHKEIPSSRRDWLQDATGFKTRLETERRRYVMPGGGRDAAGPAATPTSAPLIEVPWALSSAEVGIALRPLSAPIESRHWITEDSSIWSLRASYSSFEIRPAL